MSGCLTEYCTHEVGEWLQAEQTEEGLDSLLPFGLSGQSVDQNRLRDERSTNAGTHLAAVSEGPLGALAPPTTNGEAVVQFDGP